MLKWKRFSIVAIIGGGTTIISRLALKATSTNLPISPLVYTIIGLALTIVGAIALSVEDY